MPGFPGEPNAQGETERYTFQDARRDYHREQRERAINRRRLNELHGTPPDGFEWVETQNGSTQLRRMSHGGRPGRPRSNSEIEQRARIVHACGANTETGEPNAWITADHAYLILRRFDPFAEDIRFYVGPPARDVSGNIRFDELAETLCVAKSQPKARAWCKMRPVDVESLRGHHEIDPFGQPGRSEGSIDEALASGDLSIGD